VRRQVVHRLRACLLYKGSRFFKASGDREESITCKSPLSETHARALNPSKGNDAHHIGHDHVGGFFTHLGKECHACLDASLWKRFFVGCVGLWNIGNDDGEGFPEEPPRPVDDSVPGCRTLPTRLVAVAGTRAIPYSPSLSFGPGISVERPRLLSGGYWEHVSMASMAAKMNLFNGWGLFLR